MLDWLFKFSFVVGCVWSVACFGWLFVTKHVWLVYLLGCLLDCRGLGYLGIAFDLPFVWWF